MKKQHNAILHIGIVGGGPRGLVVLERLTHYATKYDIPLVISIIDPQQPGAGVHSPSLPEYKMLNTVAGQITLFPDENMLEASEESRPVCTFIEWCRQHKSLPDFWYTHENRRLCSWDFLPRSWLGEYLQWAYDHIVSQVGPEVTIRHIPAAAVDIDQVTDKKFMITLNNEEILHVDAVYLTTGHGQGAGETSEYISAGSSVLLQGMGLTAIDTIADWTTGRGGRFSPRSGGIPEYIPSGKEPEIFLTSRSGLPFRCRPESLTLGGNITRDAVIFRTLLQVLRDSPEAFPLTAAGCEDDTQTALADLLARAGFTAGQVQELQWHRIRWPQMSQEEADRRELNSLLDDLERQQMYCRRDQLVDIVFSPVRKPGESWTERLHWLLMTDKFGFRSPLSREAAARALAILAGYTGREVAEHLATVMVWNDAGSGIRTQTPVSGVKLLPPAT